jgi:hypothetical protein
MTMAERELGAFISAVTQLYGPEEARISAEDWLDELESMDGLPGSTSSEWRQITIAAAARIASRLVGGTSFSGMMQPTAIRKFKSTCAISLDAWQS